jgi:hypothetical protein
MVSGRSVINLAKICYNGLMSLNWKEIDLVLSELDLAGSQIQQVFQSAYDVLCLRLYGKGRTSYLLIALTPGACRLHETHSGAVKGDRPLRFAEFFKSRHVNGWIEDVVQMGTTASSGSTYTRGKTITASTPVSGPTRPM